MFKKRRLIKSGSFGRISNGGVYNPSVLLFDNQLICATRVEEFSEIERVPYDNTSANIFITLLTAELKLIDSFSLELRNFPPCRIEDFRLFEFKNKLYCSHPITQEKTEQCISLIDLKEKTLTLQTVFTSPFKRNIEKNWGFFSQNDELFFLYSINPWVIFKIIDNKLELIHRDNFKPQADELVSVSSHPIAYQNNFLTIIHSRIEGKYYQSSILFDKELKPIYFSDTFLQGGKEKGLRKNVLYVSSCLEQEKTIHLFYGEGDTHSSVYSISKSNFNKLIYKNKV